MALVLSLLLLIWVARMMVMIRPTLLLPSMVVVVVTALLMMCWLEMRWLFLGLLGSCSYGYHRYHQQKEKRPHQLFERYRDQALSVAGHHFCPVSWPVQQQCCEF